MLTQRIRAHLRQVAQTARPITYKSLATAVEVAPPHTIHQVTLALERLIEEDAAAARPLIAALVISKARGGLPAPGFFDCCGRVGLYQGDGAGPQAQAFHTAELERAIEFWGAPLPD